MARVTDISEARIAFQVAGSDADRLLVSRYRGTEGLSQLYRFELDLVAEGEDIVLDDIVGRQAALTVHATHGERWVHGLVSRFEHVGETQRQRYFRADLVPSLWLLAQRYQSRIFQNKTTLQIIAEVLERAGFTSDYLKADLRQRSDYREREYCVQYRETDLNFFSRLLEDEGITYFFQHA